MKAAIEQRLSENLSRVNDLVALYVSHSGGEKGRPSVLESNILRAAFILLHATLEDLLRGLADWRLAGASPEVLKELPLAGAKDQRKTNFTLGELAAHRGRTINDVIQQSVVQWLSRLSYNNLGDVKVHLVRVAIDPAALDPYKADIAALMFRRHHIAHQLDRNDLRGRSHHQAQSLRKATAERWKSTVEALGPAILAAC